MVWIIAALFCLATQVLVTAACSPVSPHFPLTRSADPFENEVATLTRYLLPWMKSDFSISRRPVCQVTMGSDTQPQSSRGDQQAKDEKEEAEHPSTEEDDYFFDENGCPDVKKNAFYCMLCGGADENGNCKGDPLDNNEYLGCKCTPDPDWSQEPRPLRRPDYRKHKQAIRDLFRDDKEKEPEPAKKESRSRAETTAVRTALPQVTMTALWQFALK
ncbi:hypothetical protein T440DRAFT_469798 [Plenodomus tracheiphilus IPT5]|uniref:Uncharacterized protein n=1 Tax=Plenodomus tracheiphilus IPT5 TaxID=1408161 RepID=A0A6A7B0K3_9PLEO|nr:hypothetical protein T440DRAFT_469798 [Plenodomus tracheiphilus IPT5]